MADVVHPVLLLVGESSRDPIRVSIEGYGLEMAVVSKDSLALLGPEWQAPGLYILLGQGDEPGRYTAYVGEAAKSGVRTRVAQHRPGQKRWDRALLIRGRDFDSAAIGYLEGLFYDVLKNAVAAEVLNRVPPRDETVPAYRRPGLDRYAQPVTLAMRALGCPPDTADQQSARPHTERRVFKESVMDLLDAGLLKAGTRLRPVRQAYDEPATVLPDGTLEVEGKVYRSVSAAAVAVSGNSSEPGWEFWAAASGDGSQVTLYALRDRLRAATDQDAAGIPAPPVKPGTGSDQKAASSTPAADPDPQEPVPPAPDRAAQLDATDPPARPSKPRRFDVPIEQLLQAGWLEPNETLVSLRKNLGTVEAVLREDGTVYLAGVGYRSLSGAARAASGMQSEPGWEFWAVRRNEKLVSLYDLRAAYLRRSQPPRSPYAPADPD